MMSLPKSRDELRERWQSGERFRFLFFYGHKAPETGVDDSCFSQWYARTFTVDQIEYLTAEHWMMAEKARLFGDAQMEKAIIEATTPKEAKAFGRKVENFEAEIWDQHKNQIVFRGNYEKFTQHEDLMAYLLATRQLTNLDETILPDDRVQEKLATYEVKAETNVILVEAAGRDMIWGIGLGKNNPKAQNPLTWRGRNLLGFVLTAVRDTIYLEQIDDK